MASEYDSILQASSIEEQILFLLLSCLVVGKRSEKMPSAHSLMLSSLDHVSNIKYAVNLCVILLATFIVTIVKVFN